MLSNSRCNKVDSIAMTTLDCYLFDIACVRKMTILDTTCTVDFHLKDDVNVISYYILAKLPVIQNQGKSQMNRPYKFMNREYIRSFKTTHIGIQNIHGNSDSIDFQYTYIYE